MPTTSVMDAYTGESAWIAWTREGLPIEARGEQEERRLRYCVIRFLTERHIPERLEDIDGKHVVLFFTGILGRRAHSKAVYVEALKSFFGWAASQGLVKEDPMVSPLVGFILSGGTT